MAASPVKEALGAVNLGKIPGQIALYEQLVDAAEPLFQLKGRTLGEAIAQHAQDLMFYDITLQECKTIEDVIKMKVDEIESKLYRKYNEGMQRALGQRDIVAYIKGDPEYVAAYEILLEVAHVKRQLESIVEALKTMGWSLSNITKLRIAQLEHVNI